ncbi:MAG: tyrosine-type recombinase/integrase [Anaerolineae bacterium]
MTGIGWERYPHVAQHVHARTWLTIQANLGRAANTIEAYGRALDDFLAFSSQRQVEPDTATREHIAAYVHDLASRANPHSTLTTGLANATLRQRLTAVRLYYDYLLEEGQRTTNPVGRGKYTPSTGFAGHRDLPLIPHYRKLPWIPTDEQWRAILEAARSEPIRNRVMLALAYDAGLRREELCALAVGDIDPAHRLLHLRAETTKNHQARVVPYSQPTSVLYTAYLQHRRKISQARGPLFVSESRRNRGQPISIWTWSKVVEAIAERAGVAQFTTHTPRHLCLTDLARADWDLHHIAAFAGHRSVQTTLLYIHLSGRDLAAKVAQGMADLHAWRVACLGEVLG